ncbi:hypothetical protein EYF80_049508 [Liparis tanakae]|uniref:MADF domain-containing protein n=1 Tax=Liparis tanakae TaxID=230148 RepID=A0A4Z2FGL2_9TELE|nr:hypothetical protein EYF80_049508 [Liparis tanakae]
MKDLLIQAVSGFPNLYDPNAPGYGNRDMLADSWRRVSEAMAVPEEECRRTWTNLRRRHYN